MDYATITTAVTSLKTAVELVKGIVSAKTAEAIREKASELQNVILNLQGTILSMQVDYSELLKKNEELEKKVTKREEWQKTIEKYELKEISSGNYAYVPKPATEEGQITYWLCTKCFEDGKKSIIQKKDANYAYVFYICPECKTTFTISLKNIKGLSIG